VKPSITTVWKDARMLEGNRFESDQDLATGANQLNIEAKDGSNNVSNYTYNLTLAAATAATPSYDADGNLLSDGVRSYEWDRMSRLVKITWGGSPVKSTEYRYNALGQRSEQIEKINTTETARFYFLYGGKDLLCRYTGGTAVANIDRQYLSQGEQRKSGSAWSNYYYNRDHLGSIREVMNSNGSLAARYDYDPYGKRLAQYEASGYACDLGFTGHITQQSGVSGQGEIVLTLFRAYDPQLGRWLSADPLGEMGGMNLYAYVGGNPINFWDILGLTGYPSTFVGPLRGDDYYIPDGPPGADVKANCDKAKKIINPFTFKSMVKNKGPWDYKQHGRQYEDFGNYNYGATGHAFGFSLNTLYNEAGRAQVTAKTSNPAFGKPAPRLKMLFGCDGTGSRGDDPNDQLWIKRGYESWRPYHRGSK
jgi:RHS repeat-associated protein